MKPPFFPGKFLVACVLIFAALPFLLAGVEKNDDGTYTITGSWTYWPERDLVAPSGKNDFGEYKTILFKSAVNDFAGMKELKKTPAAFKVRARVSGEGADQILVVEEILEKMGDENPAPPAK